MGKGMHKVTQKSCNPQINEHSIYKIVANHSTVVYGSNTVTHLTRIVKTSGAIGGK